MPEISTSVIVDIDDIAEIEFPVEVCYNKVDNYGWIEGSITVRGVCRWYSCYYVFKAKVYDTPSKYGIDDGCISKLY